MQSRLTTVEFVRSYTGLLSAIANDDKVELLISVWSSIVTNYCGVPFEETETVLYLDGNNSRTLFIAWPIINVDSLRMNDAIDDDDDAVDSSLYSVYTNPGNPMIKLKDTTDLSLFAKLSCDLSGTRFAFLTGSKNQRVDGIFGRVDESGPQDGNGAPLVVQCAIARLVSLDARGAVRDPVGLLRSDIVEEWTDGHRLVFSQRVSRTSIEIPDPVSQNWLSKFVGPIKLASPNNRGPSE